LIFRLGVELKDFEKTILNVKQLLMSKRSYRLQATSYIRNPNRKKHLSVAQNIPFWYDVRNLKHFFAVFLLRINSGSNIGIHPIHPKDFYIHPAFFG